MSITSSSHAILNLTMIVVMGARIAVVIRGRDLPLETVGRL